MGGLGLDGGGAESGTFSTTLGTDFNVDAFGIEVICSHSVSAGVLRYGVAVDTASRSIHWSAGLSVRRSCSSCRFHNVSPT